MNKIADSKYVVILNKILFSVPNLELFVSGRTVILSSEDISPAAGE
jgi:hypothetical protein